MSKIIQILDIKSTSANTELYNITAINRGRDPYWVEFMQPYCSDIGIDIKILPLSQINLNKIWLVNVDINMWNWNNFIQDIFEDFDPLIKKELKTGKAYIILNHQCESWTKAFFNIFYRKKIDIPFHKIIYMAAAADIEEQYNNYMVQHEIPKNKKINTMFVHHVYKRFTHDVDIDGFKYTPTAKTKKFLSLNRRWRKHRLMLVSLLSQKNLLEQGFVSLGLMPDEITKAKLLLTNEDLIQGFEKLEKRFPLQIDNVDLTVNQFSMNSLPITFYQHSCFSLVSSTMALREEEPSVGFTEKEIKPILAKHPFIIWNRPGVLKHLQSMGFLTFSPWIDESYDNESDDMIRLYKIVEEVERLCNYSFDEWKIILDEMQSVLDHNYNRMVNYTNEHCFFNSDLKKLLYYAS